MLAPFNEKLFSLDWRNKIISAEHQKIGHGQHDLTYNLYKHLKELFLF